MAVVVEELARVFNNELRVRLLVEYGREETSPSRVAARLGERVNLVSYHTRVLERHGCVRLVRTQQRRGGVEHVYRSTIAPELEDAGWADLPLPLRRALINGTLGSALDDARRAAVGGGFDGPRTHLSRIWLELDEPAQAAVADLLRRTTEAVDAIAADCRARAPARTEPYELVVAHFGRGSAP
jgi:hypothetical protein